MNLYSECNPSTTIVGKSYNDIYHLCLREVRNNGDRYPDGRIGGFKEIPNFSFRLLNPYDRMVWNPERKVNYEFAMKFFLWMLNGRNDAAYVTGVNPNAKNYLDPAEGKEELGKTFSTAYGPRITLQLAAIVEELAFMKNSRRGTIVILENYDWTIFEDKESKTEFPCAISVSFFVRNEKLNCSAVFRSNNYFTTICYDVFNMTMLQEAVLRGINARLVREGVRPIEMGWYEHISLSAHTFLSDGVKISDTLGAYQNGSLEDVNRPHLFCADDLNVIKETESEGNVTEEETEEVNENE